MGVPKFFRFISERYPCLSEVVKEYQIPEFDNLYLDMNGIIHVCSHPNDFDPHFRISEEEIIKDIFHYIETLFRMIKPRKLFFMAVDGVAPRAKMNQQRGRRFKSAKEAESLEAKARLKGEKLPDVERFDSNCITPGTVFMARLHAQLKYFVNYKISTDKLWQQPTVILSGHETPGEGEHKIMDYIRYLKSKPDYDCDTRHCLYGLDADLIMLGLCTHEPHFSLLREEVKFGKKTMKGGSSRSSAPEEITFYLLHLSLMREYIELEFQKLKTSLPFPFNLENIIDDWVLMGFLVGNDFIPHLPNLHIAEGALPILYEAYIDVLPTLGGYINEGGLLNLERFQKYMAKLSSFDFDQFKDIFVDMQYMESKTKMLNDSDRHKRTEEDRPRNSELAALIQMTDQSILGDDDSESFSLSDEDDEALMFAEFYQHKNDYYVNKLSYDKVTPEVLRSQAEGYVRAIQWNLHYYYNGCCSWSWFYPHHYAPYISDIRDFSDLKLKFDLAEPFLPFQQLLAVLPAASKKLLPEPFQELMVNEDSPIIDFYPTDFKTDMNGKKQEWEAVVLIPFIEQESLLSAMASRYDRLTDEEKRRNSHGPMHVYNYTPEDLGMYEAPEYFPTISNSHAKETPVHRDDIYVERENLVKGLCPGVKLDVYFPGFPTLKHLEFKGTLKKAKVKVFEQLSRGDNMILTLNGRTVTDIEKLASELIDKVVFVGWPHLREAKVKAIASNVARYKFTVSSTEKKEMVTEPHAEPVSDLWYAEKRTIEDQYKTRLGVDVNKTEVLVYATTMEGRKYSYTNLGRCSLEKQWASYPTSFAYQTIVEDIAVHDEQHTDNLAIEELFKPSSVCFMLGAPYYGAIGTVYPGGKEGRVKLSVSTTTEPNLDIAVSAAKRQNSIYMPGHIMAQRLGLSGYLLSRITGSIFIVDSEPGDSTEGAKRTNIGLNLKFSKKNEEICGYTKKENGHWLYSPKAEMLVRTFIQMAPDLLEYISANLNSDVFCLKEVFPEDSEKKLAQVTEWIRKQDVSRASRQKCGSEVLEEEVIKIVEKIVNNQENRTGKTYTMQVKPHLLYKPTSSIGRLCPDPQAIHRLFDRIICVRESHTVPLGLKGTIIGIHRAELESDVCYDLLFDQEFPGGHSLNGSSNRCCRMTRQGFLNLTHGSRLDNAKTSKVQSNNTMYNQYSNVDTKQFRNNSAFASWKNKQEPLVKEAEETPFMKGLKGRHAKGSQMNQNQGPQNPNRPSSEFQAMWDELQKVGTKGPSKNMQSLTNQPDITTDALKKMLKIADNSTTKPKSVPTNQVSENTLHQQRKDAPAFIPQGPKQLASNPPPPFGGPNLPNMGSNVWPPMFNQMYPGKNNQQKQTMNQNWANHPPTPPHQWYRQQIGYQGGNQYKVHEWETRNEHVMNMQGSPLVRQPQHLHQQQQSQWPSKHQQHNQMAHQQLQQQHQPQMSHQYQFNQHWNVHNQPNSGTAGSSSTNWRQQQPPQQDAASSGHPMPFVPLQAVKQFRNKPNAALPSSQMKNSTNNMENAAPTPAASVIPSRPPTAAGARKSRIAANFSNQLK